MSKLHKTIPYFANAMEELAFWETHDSTEYLDWSKAQSVVLPNLKLTTKTIALRLPQHLLNTQTDSEFSWCALPILDKTLDTRKSA